MKKRTSDPSPAAQVNRELQETALALRRAYQRFDFACEAELVDASVYEINSLQARYSYLLRAAKEAEPEAVPAFCAAAEEGRPCRS